MKKGFIILSALVLLVASAFTLQPTADNANKEENIENAIIYLDAETFKEKVFNYEENQEWKYNGEVPAILDFYADWCGPCKMLSPVLKKIQDEYDGKVQIYKINTDEQRELSSTFGIRSLPTIVFVPMEGEPQATMGYRSKNDLETMISEILKVEK
ncbi:thioredoxin [Carboxylicivirga sp. M1479]|uniref:thioredoxin n=1 Tax=Carboxylicivirga sp. M1479 TaxID=2594476 RepID=UPI0011785D53|nr:thioredoxin [Carboxylicivirga sp. M1479]TRX66113.1 thioredoxin [Carboxylicivirga sp. M1479]